jgi:uncharacterized repeat protein (TIGR04076 family)
MSMKEEVLKIGDLWSEPAQFKVTVIKKGNCRANHKTGETFEFSWNTPEGLCGESFVGMYPVLHSLRVMGDMRELGSPHRNVRIYNCPSRVIKFQIEATYLCNLCGKALSIEENESIGHILKNPETQLYVRVCPKCFESNKDKTLVW